MPHADPSPSSEPDLLRALVDKLPAMLAYWDANQRCRFANRAYEMWFGVKPEAMIGRDMAEFLGPLYALNRPYIEGVLRGEAQEFERDIPDPEGGPARHSQAHYIPDVSDGVVRGFCVLVVDVTRRKRAEEAVQRMERKLQATERLVAMATLAGGIAHEINNPLAVVLANLDRSIADLERGGGAVDAAALTAALGEARTGAKRVQTIVRSLQLLGGGDTKRERVDVDEALERSLTAVESTLRYRAQVVRELGAPGHVDGNGAQLVQVFASLLMNAVQAMPEERSAANEIRVSSRREGGDVVVEVRDNGRGVPPELQTRIFEPFFTTKDVGGGMGLGLSIASGIVRAFGGTITVSSKVSEGSTFRVVLPAAPPVPPAVQARRRAHPMASAARLRILVVDDEVVLSRILQSVLGSHHDVTAVNHGHDAIELLLRGEPDFDLVLCDLMMPGVTGADVYARATEARPELAERFVIMTGGAFTPRGRAFLESVDVPVLEKPFDLELLGALVRDRAAAVSARSHSG